MQLVRPVALVPVLAREHISQVDVADVCELLKGAHALQHLVEAVDEVCHDLPIDRSIRVLLPSKPRLEPGSGQEPESTEETPTIGYCVRIAMRDDGQRTLLFELDQTIQRLTGQLGADNAELVGLQAIYHNLVRRWVIT